MNDQFFTCEYTWSDHSITGGEKEGWGITSVSHPIEKDFLHEMEKIAAPIPADYQTKEETEGLSYSPVCGYVRFRCRPDGYGRDKRRNKKVFLYRMGMEDEPAVYMKELPHGEPDTFAMEKESFREMVIDLGMENKLPLLLRYSYECVAGVGEPVNFYLEDLNAEDARKSMFVIHSMLPPSLRRRAGYLVAKQRGHSQLPFLFSSGAVEERACHLQESQWKPEQCDALESLFYESLAQAMMEDNEEISNFFDKSEELIQKDDTNLLMKMKWLFYKMYRDRDGEILPFRLLSQTYPDLLYQGTESKILAECADTVSNDILSCNSTPQENADYFRMMTRAITHKTKEPVMEELSRVSRRIFETDKKLWESLMNQFMQSNLSLFAEFSAIEKNIDGDYGAAMDKKQRAALKEIKERRGRRKEKKMAAVKESTKEITPKEEPVSKAIPTEANVREIDDIPMTPLLLTSVPQGFLTGCVLFLAWYSVRIGHWKIALGLGGMWLLIMLNYRYLILHLKTQYPVWAMVGLCLLEGMMVQLVAWFLPTKKIRLTYFIILGLITVITQVINILRRKRQLS